MTPAHSVVEQIPTREQGVLFLPNTCPNLPNAFRNSFTLEKVALASEIMMFRDTPVGIGSKGAGTIRGQSIFFC